MSVKKSYGSPAGGYSRSIETKISPFGRSHSKSPSRNQPSPGSTFTSDYLRKRNDELEVTGKVLASKNHAIAKKLSAVESTLVEAKRVIKDLRRELSHQAHKTAGCTRVQIKEVSHGADSPVPKRSVAAQTTPGVFTKANPPHEPNTSPRPKFSGRSSFRSPLDVSSPPEKIGITRADMPETVINRALFANELLAVNESDADSMHSSTQASLRAPSDESLSRDENMIAQSAERNEDEDEFELSLASISVLSPLVSEQNGYGSLNVEFGAPSPPPRIPAPEFGNAAFIARLSTGSICNSSPPSSEADSNKVHASPPKIFADADMAQNSILTTAVMPAVQVPTRPVLTSLLDCPPISGQLYAASDQSPIKLLKSPKSTRSAEKSVRNVIVAGDKENKKTLNFGRSDELGSKGTSDFHRRKSSGNISNEVQYTSQYGLNSRPRRRSSTGVTSYKEPSLSTKIRKGHEFFPKAQFPSEVDREINI